MSNRVKLIIGIFGVFIIGVIVAMGVWSFVSQPEDAQQNENVNISGPIEPVISTTFIQAQDELGEQSGPVINNQPEDLLFLELETSQVLRRGSALFVIDSEGRINNYENGELTTAFEFGEPIIFASISPNGNDVFVKTEGFQNFVVNIESGERSTLPEEIQNLVWSPSGDRVVYQFVDAFDRINGLFIANPDATDFRQVFDFGSDNLSAGEFDLYWPASDVIIWRPQATSIDGTPIYRIDAETGDSSEITLEEDVALGITPSLDGTKLYYDVFQGGVDENFNEAPSVYEIKEYDISTRQVQEIGLQALAEKCVSLPQDKLVCAITGDDVELISPEMLIEFDINSKQVTPLTEINADAPINYAGIQYIASRNEIVYINTVSGQFSRLSLNR